MRNNPPDITGRDPKADTHHNSPSDEFHVETPAQPPKTKRSMNPARRHQDRVDREMRNPEYASAFNEMDAAPPSDQSTGRSNLTERIGLALLVAIVGLPIIVLIAKAIQ